MRCHLFGAKPLSKLVMVYCQLDPSEQTSVKLYQNTKLFIHENASECIVFDMATILSMGDEFSHPCVHWNGKIVVLPALSFLDIESAQIDNFSSTSSDIKSDNITAFQFYV